MRRKDAYAGDDDAARARSRSFAPARLGRDARASSSRGAALERELLPRARSAAATSRALFALRRDARAAVDDLAGARSGAGPRTHLGDALAAGARRAPRAARHRRGARLRRAPERRRLRRCEAARAAGAAGIPVHTRRGRRHAPGAQRAASSWSRRRSSALEGDEIAITVRVLGRGTTEGQVRASSCSRSSTRRRRARAGASGRGGVALDEDGERVVADRAAPATADRATRRAPLPRLARRRSRARRCSTTTRSRSACTSRPRRCACCYVDGYPRWEYRFLKNAAQARGREHRGAVLPALGDARLPAGEHARHAGRSTAVPDRPAQELLDNYDVVILGDVNPVRDLARPGAVRGVPDARCASSSSAAAA